MNKEALKKYGRHYEDCHLEKNALIKPYVCTCGFSEALLRAEELKDKDEKFNTLANHIVDMNLAIIGWKKKLAFNSEDDLIGELERMIGEALKLVPQA